MWIGGAGGCKVWRLKMCGAVYSRRARRPPSLMTSLPACASHFLVGTIVVGSSCASSSERAPRAAASPTHRPGTRRSAITWQAI